MDKSLLQGSRQEMARSEPHENCEVEGEERTAVRRLQRQGHSDAVGLRRGASGQGETSRMGDEKGGPQHEHVQGGCLG